MLGRFLRWLSALAGGGEVAGDRHDGSKQGAGERNLFDLDLSQGEGRVASAARSLEMDEQRAAEFVESMQSVPTLPALWGELQSAFARGESAKVICRLINEDPPLVSEILAQANALSRREIVDASQAIVRLGFPAVRSIAMRHFLAASHPSGPSPYVAAKLWRHAMSTSALAALLAKQIRGCDAATAATLGLLHDIGRIGINATYGRGVAGRADPEQGYLLFEHERFGFDHLQAGLLLARHWQLPEALQEGVVYHHHPAHSPPTAVDAAIRREVCAVYLADLLSIYFGNAGGHDLIVPPDDGWLEMLSGSLDDFAASRAVGKELWRISCIEL
ncbi:MAG: HDOD domain-containing protein [Mariprofundales bacterium]|nr:HDOD domain-containing protein [Mariprofundales bacterium]